MSSSCCILESTSGSTRAAVWNSRASNTERRDSDGRSSRISARSAGCSAPDRLRREREPQPRRVGQRRHDVLPADEPLLGAEVARARPHEAHGGLDAALPAEPAREPAQADVDVREHEPLARQEEVQVVDALDLRPRHVHDLLVEQRLAQADLGHLPAAARAQLRHARRQRDGVLRPRAHLAAFGDEEQVRLSGRADEELPDGRVRLGQLNGEVPELADRLARGVHDRAREQLREVQERPDRITAHARVPARHRHSVGDAREAFNQFPAGPPAAMSCCRSTSSSQRIEPRRCDSPGLHWPTILVTWRSGGRPKHTG